MSFLIDQLKTACQYLECDKATDRKKNADAIKRLIQHHEVIQLLNERWSSGGKSRLSYTLVFMAVHGFLFKESELLHHKAENLTPSLLTTRLQKLKEMSSLLRLVVKTACKGCPKIKIPEFVNALLMVLRRDFQKDQFGGIYLDLLVNEVLTTRSQISNVTTDQWKELIGICCSFLEKRKYLGMGVLRMMQIFKHVLFSLLLQCDPSDFMFLFSFFENAIRQKNLYSGVALEYLLHCILEFFKCQVQCNAHEVLVLGKSTLRVTIGLLPSKTVNCSAKKKLLDLSIFQLQTMQYSLFDEEFYWSGASNSWIHLLKDLLFATESYVCSSKAANTKDGNVLELGRSLAALILRKMYEAKYKELTTIDQDVEILDVTGNAHKEMSDPQFVLKLINQRIDAQSLNNAQWWIKVLQILLEQCRVMFSEKVRLVYAESLYKLLTRKVSNDITESILSCLNHLCLMQTTVQDAGRFASVWKDIFELTRQFASSLVNLKNLGLSNSSFELMAAILENKAIKSNSVLGNTSNILITLWPTIYMSQKPTRGFLRFLWVYIKSNGLEERTDHHQPTVDELENLDLLKLKEIMPIRCGIIEWILGYLKSDFRCKTVDSQLNSPEIMVKMAAVLLIALCCEEPAACLSRMSEKNCKSDENSTTFNPLHVSFWFSPTVVKISKEFGIVEKRSEIETSCWQDIKYQFPFHFFLKTIQQFVESNVKGLRGITVEEHDTMVVLQGLNAARLLLHLALEWTFNDWETFVQSFEVLFSGISKLLKLFEISFKGNPQNNLVHNGIFTILNGINSVLRFLSSNSSPRKEKILEVIDRELQSFKEISLSLFRALIFAKKSATGCAGSNCSMSESFDELESAGFNDSFSSTQNLSDKVSGERSLIDTLYEDVKGQNEAKKNEVESPDEKRLLNECTRLIIMLQEITGSNDWSQITNLFNIDQFKLSEESHAKEMIFFIKNVDALSSRDFTQTVAENLIKLIEGLFRYFYRDQHFCAACLEALSCVIRKLPKLKNADVGNTTCHQDIVALLQIIRDLISKDACGPEVKIGYLLCLSALATSYQTCENSSFDSHSLDTKFGVCCSMTELLGDASLGVRLCSVHHLKIVFKHEAAPEDQDLELEFRKKVLKVAQSCRFRKDFHDTKNDVKRNVRKLNQLSSYIHMLASTTLHGARYLDCEVAMEICVTAAGFEQLSETKFLIIRRKFIEIVKSGSERFALNLQQHTGDAPQEKFSSFLPFILSQWQCGGHSTWKNFPYFLFGCVSMEKFNQTFLELFVPVLVFENSQSAEKIKEKVLEHYENLKVVGKCVSTILPVLIANLVLKSTRKPSQLLLQIDERHGSEILRWLCAASKYRNTSIMATENLSLVVHGLFSMFHPLHGCAGKAMWVGMGKTDPLPYTFAAIDEYLLGDCIQKLLQLCGVEFSTNNDDWKESFINLLVSHGHFHLLMHLMHEAISVARNLFEMKRAVLSYRYFCLLAVESLEALGDLQQYFVRSCLSVMCYHINEIAQKVKSNPNDSDSQSYYPVIASICIDLCFEIITTALQLVSMGCVDLLVSPTMVHVVLSSLFSIYNACHSDFGCLNQTITQIYGFLMENRNTSQQYGIALQAYSLYSRNKINVRIHNTNVTNTPVISQEEVIDTNGSEKLEILVEAMTCSISMGELGYHVNDFQTDLLEQGIVLLEELKKGNRKIEENIFQTLLSQAMKLQREGNRTKALFAKFIGLITSQICKADVTVQSRQDNTSLNRILNHVCDLMFHSNPHIAQAAVSSTMQLVKMSDVEKVITAMQIEHKCAVGILKGFKVITSKEEKVLEGSASLLNDEQLWSCRHDNFDVWICSLTSAVLQASKIDHLRALMGICRLSPKLCSYALPYAFLQVLLLDRNMKDVLAQGIMRTFNSAFEKGTNEPVNQPSILTMLSAVQCLREHYACKSTSYTSSRNQKVTGQYPPNLLQNLDMLVTAKVALLCDRPFQAILFTELWCDGVEDSLYKSMETNKPSTERPKARSSGGKVAPVFPTNGQGATINALSKDKKQSLMESRQLGKCCALDVLHELGSEGKEAMSILAQAYNTIEDIDGLYGVVVSPVHGSQNAPLLNMYEKEGCWDKALKSRDLLLSIPSTGQTNMGEIVASLQNCGLSHICAMYMRGIAKDHTACSSDELLLNLQYKSAWTAGQWDMAKLHRVHGRAEVPFHQHMYQAMSSIHNNSHANFETSVRNARLHTVGKLISQSTNCLSSNVQTVSSRLQCLDDMEQLESMLYESSDARPLLAIWSRSAVLPDANLKFEDVDLVMTSRSTLFSLLLSRTSNSDRAPIFKSFLHHLLSCVKSSCKFGRLQHAKKLLVQLKSATQNCAEQSSKEIWSFKLSMENAKLLWQQQDQVFALAALQNLKSQLLSCTLGHDDITLLRSEALRVLGEWLHELHFVAPSEILEDYLLKALKLSENLITYLSHEDELHSETTQEIVAGCFALAKFADQQYLQITKYKLSNEYAQKKVLAEAPTQEMRIMQQMGEELSKKTQIIVNKNSNIDLAELSRIESKENMFLKCALETYIKCLRMSDEHDTLMNRICSLWFSNNLLDVTNDLISDGHKTLPSYKYISLAYQLAARLKSPVNDAYFQSILQEILLRVTVDHPYHTLYIVLALIHAHKDNETFNPPPSKRSKSEKIKKNAVTNSTITAATKLLTNIERTKQDLVTATRLLCCLYIELANFDASPWRNQPGQTISMPKSLPFYKLCDPKSKLCLKLQDVNLPTVETPLDKTAKYDETAGIVKFRSIKPFFQTCGGVNLPKVVVAVGSDGFDRKHLVKGRDDLRQDAVMQQVFQLVNVLLTKDPNTKSLSIQTYKVVPLSQKSGLVQWCDETIPIGVYLVGNPIQGEMGAHHRHRPHDMSAMACRKALGSVGGKGLEVKFGKYKEICAKFKPVFRHFFTEKFVVPRDWFAKRQSYTKSVAVSSIVGYVLGLGDRHVQNILINCNTAEIVHIDLGVAFEQGRCLPTPETVPFRLTRDIVDGMGLCGVEGVFRRCCEKTMVVMRSSYDAITTIVEVLLYDPLHDWTLSPSKARTLQRNADSTIDCSFNSTISTCSIKTDVQSDAQNTNKLAERVLLRLQEKLLGTEEGSVLSVRGQVNMLIQQASDPVRLCQLFAGWQPYL